MAHPEPAPSPDASFEVRWAEGIAVGARRERETTRRFRIALPIIAAFAVAGPYLLVR